MTRLDKLMDEAHSLGIIVDDTILPEESKLDGLYIRWECFNLSIILLNAHRPVSVRVAVLAEEIGHHATCAGNALGDSLQSKKKEAAGRNYAYKQILPACALCDAIRKGSHTLYELEDSLNLPSSFIEEAFDYFMRKGHITITAISNGCTA